MIKKFTAAAVIAVLAIFGAPMTANAAYVSPGNISVTGSPTPGGTVTVGFIAGSFTGGEDVAFAATGAGLNFNTVKAAAADGSTSIGVTLPEDATGSYTITATGLTSTDVGVATVTVVPADAGSGVVDDDSDDDDSLAFTGAGGFSVLLVWSAAGILLLGAALIAVLSIVRRQRSNA